MAYNSFQLLKRRRFLPLFITVCLGSFNDNIYRNAMVILVTFGLAQTATMDSELIVTIATGVFILPSFLLCATAGRLADKFEKHRLIQIVKAGEVLIFTLAAVALYSGSVTFLLVVLFLMGVDATFLGPVKYGILPVHLKTSELMSGNALVEGGTFLAILLGTILGGVLILSPGGLLAVSFLQVAVALAGFIASFAIPPTPRAAPHLRIGWNIASETWEMIRYASARSELLQPILGVSWFWLLGSIFFAQFPAFAKDVLGGDDHVVTLFFTAFSVGIGVGSLLCGRLLKGEISARYVPAAAAAMSLLILDLYLMTRHLKPDRGLLEGISPFLSHPRSWRILVDLLLISMASGFFVVPLNTLMQERSESAHRARVIAANNIMNALFMVVGSIFAGILIQLGLGAPEIFLIFGAFTLLVAFHFFSRMPQETARLVFYWVLRLLYRVELRGLANYAAAGERVVIVANHTSFLDAVLIASFLPGWPVFVINLYIARLWWVKPALRLVDALTID
jgi:acyl-[acyl-carrier-protein]-phospholipid O-acyltransferase/long-chain-fatty-acid--[acyl-carrier-protein] ligase